MRQPHLQETEEPRDAPRFFISCAAASLLHLALFALFQSYKPIAFEVKTDPISVELVALSDISPPAPPSESAEQIEPTPPAPKPPVSKPIPQPAPEPRPTPELLEPPKPVPDVVLTPPPASATPTPDILPPEGQSSLPVQAAPSPQGNVLIPDRWRLPVGARIPLDKIGPAEGSFQHSLDCLKGFDAACAEQRKTVFSDDQLSETDLVWMASHPHSGLSDASLHGLSEAEIRQRLGIPTAGNNGFMILPGIGIDGPLWDMLHGVNKACDYSLGIGENGQKELRKSCGGNRPASGDKIAFKPLVE